MGSMDGPPVLLLILLWLFGLLMYLLPGAIAQRRAHHQQTAIWVLNIFAGWTVVGWIAALVWASTAVQPRPAIPAK
jgi:hypothetical protein